MEHMGYPLRIEFAGALHHVTTRGNDRKPIFLDDHDRELFLEIVEEVVGRLGWRCVAYCLMTNHYHLLVETPEPNLAGGLRHLNSVYARRFNRRHRRRDHLFGERYSAILVERDAHLLEVARYVVLNPVRAGLCRTAGGWAWSSYRATAGRSPEPPFLAVGWLLGLLAPRRAAAMRRYRAFVAAVPRRAASPLRHVRRRIVLGSTEFARRHADPVGSRVRARATRARPRAP